MPRHRVFARRRFRHPAIRGLGRGGVLFCREIDDTSESKCAELRHPKRAVFRDVAERVAALIAVRGRVGQFATADAVEDDQNDAGEGSQIR